MLNCFPQTNQDYRLLLRTFSALLDDVADQAITETAKRFAAGDVPEQSMKFAPSAPEFVAAARRQEEIIEIRNRPKLPAPAYRSTRLSPIEISRQQAFAKFAGHPVLFEDIGHEQWIKLSKSKSVPAGAVWCAQLAIVFGPKSKPQSAAA